MLSGGGSQKLNRLFRFWFALAPAERRRRNNGNNPSVSLFTRLSGNVKGFTVRNL